MAGFSEKRHGYNLGIGEVTFRNCKKLPTIEPIDLEFVELAVPQNSLKRITDNKQESNPDRHFSEPLALTIILLRYPLFPRYLSNSGEFLIHKRPSLSLHEIATGNAPN